MKGEDTNVLQAQACQLWKEQLKEAQSVAPATSTGRTKEEERQHAARQGHRAEQALEMQEHTDRHGQQRTRLYEEQAQFIQARNTKCHWEQTAQLTGEQI